jgi:hypothetical protein
MVTGNVRCHPGRPLRKSNDLHSVTRALSHTELRLRASLSHSSREAPDLWWFDHRTGTAPGYVSPTLGLLSDTMHSSCDKNLVLSACSTGRT